MFNGVTPNPDLHLMMTVDEFILFGAVALAILPLVVDRVLAFRAEQRRRRHAKRSQNSN